MHLTVGTHVSPGPDTTAPARIDALATSPAGLLTILETHLGLTAPHSSRTEQLTALLPQLHATAGHYTRSLHADPWGTAKRLLHDHAALALEGWSGQSISTRWDTLWQVTRHLAPCEGERWQAVADALEHAAHLPLTTITLVDPPATFPGAIRRVFEALQARGVVLTPWDPPAVEQSGDLAQAQREAFTPAGDTSLQLIRSPGPREGADDLAAWLRPLLQRDDPPSIAIIGADATLDEALRRHALPGADTSRATDALALLPLALAFVPAVPDPTAVLEFLLLHPHPLPTKLRFSLARALRRTPAVGSEGWTEALARWNTDATDEQRERAAVLLTPGRTAPGDPWPLADLRARATTLARWARGRAHAGDTLDAAAAAVADQCGRCLGLLDRADEDHAPQAWIERMVAAATEDAGRPRSPAQAGLQFLRHPGALLHPADLVIWWNFTRESAGLPRPLDLTHAEREALASHGVHVRPPQAKAQAQAARWWQPLRLARQRVLLFAPRSSGPGEVLHPHPLWSEIIAKIPRDRRETRAPTLEARTPGPVSRHPTTVLPKPHPTARWQVPAGSITPRTKGESPSSLGKLVGCPLQYTLHYPAELGEQTTYALDLAPRDLGSLGHDVLAHVLSQRLTDLDQVEQLATETFERLGPLTVAALFGPGQATARDQARADVVASARALTTWLLEQNLHVVGVEADAARPLDDYTFNGRIDLIASDGTTPVVIDHKLGGRANRRDDLRYGTAVQLAAYAFMLRDPGTPAPSVGYFILRDQTLLGIAGGPFPDTAAIEGPPPEEVWEAFHAAARARWDELRQGTVIATGFGDPPKTSLSGGVYQQEPPCKWCHYDLMCGRLLEGDA